jgi:hypothetical protein
MYFTIFFLYVYYHIFLYVFIACFLYVFQHVFFICIYTNDSNIYIYASAKSIFEFQLNIYIIYIIYLLDYSNFRKNV